MDNLEHPVTSPFTGIHPCLNAGERLNAELMIDDAEPTVFDYLAEHDGRERNPAIAVQLPRGLRRLRLRGTLVNKNGDKRTFDTCWDTIWDCARYTEPLYDQTLTLPQRFQAFANALSEFEHGSRIHMSAAKKDLTADMRGTEERLGTKFPDALAALSRYDIEIGDSSFVKPFKTVTETMLAYCWYPDDDLNEVLPPNVRSRYDRSVVVFYEVGDGLGALGWDPQGVTPGEPSNFWVDRNRQGARPGEPNNGVWFWLHQGEIDSPKLLLDRDMRPLSAEDALLNVMQRFAVDTTMAEVALAAYPSSILMVDSAHPKGLLELFFRNQPVNAHNSRSGATTQPQLMFRNYD